MPRGIDWERLARARVHPLAVAILDLYAGLEEGERLSPRDVASRLDQPLGNVSYHVRALSDAGLLEPAGHERVRAAVQSFYRLA